MRKSVLAMAAVAAMGVVGSANAGYWSLSGMNYVNNGNTNTIGTSVSNMNNDLLSSPVTGGAANTLTVDADVADILGASGAGISLADNTLTYFGFDGGASGPGYFVAAFKAVGTNFALEFTGGANIGGGTQGVIASQTADSSSFATFGGNPTGAWTGSFDVADGTTLVLMFGGLANGDSFTLAVDRIVAPLYGSTFDIAYFGYSGGSYSQYAGATGATKSGLNSALYTIPVPAPVLLAGAGLIGAAALRRRMVKKA